MARWALAGAAALVFAGFAYPWPDPHAYTRALALRAKLALVFRTFVRARKRRTRQVRGRKYQHPRTSPETGSSSPGRSWLLTRARSSWPAPSVRRSLLP